MIHLILAVVVSAVLMFTLSVLFLVWNVRDELDWSTAAFEDNSLLTVRDEYVSGQMELEEFERAVEKVLRGSERIEDPFSREVVPR